jgi:uncharacterized protein (TIGR02466 family)
MSIVNLFPTPIWRDRPTQENFESNQNEVELALKYIEDKDDLSDVSYIHKEAAKRKREAHTGQEGYLINDDLLTKHNMISLEERFYSALENYLNFVQWTPLTQNTDAVIPKYDKNGEFKIMNSWVNLGEPGVMHEYHCHPGYDIAAVYYYRVSEAHGGLCFNNPNQITYSGGFPEGRMSPQNIEIIPQPGEILMFPAWMQHGTMINTAETSRVSIAVNFKYIPKEFR